MAIISSTYMVRLQLGFSAAQLKAQSCLVYLEKPLMAFIIFHDFCCTYLFTMTSLLNTIASGFDHEKETCTSIACGFSIWLAIYAVLIIDDLSGASIASPALQILNSHEKSNPWCKSATANQLPW